MRYIDPVFYRVKNIVLLIVTYPMHFLPTTQMTSFDLSIFLLLLIVYFKYQMKEARHEVTYENGRAQ